MAIREWEKMLVHSERQAQIEAEAHLDAQGQSRAQVRALIFNEAATKVLAEYSDYSNIFSAENAAELLESTGMNEHAIKLERGK